LRVSVRRSAVRDSENRSWTGERDRARPRLIIPATVEAALKATFLSTDRLTDSRSACRSGSAKKEASHARPHHNPAETDRADTETADTAEEVRFMMSPGSAVVKVPIALLGGVLIAVGLQRSASLLGTGSAPPDSLSTLVGLAVFLLVGGAWLLIGALAKSSTGTTTHKS